MRTPWDREEKKDEEQKGQTQSLMLALEPRMMFDAAGLVAAVDMDLDADDGAEALVSLESAAGEEAASNEVVFIDSRVDASEFAEDIPAGATVVTIDSDEDGLSQMSEALEGMSDVDGVHIISHGSSGELKLGADAVDSQALIANAGELQNWTESLSVDADIMIYGCNVAADADGEAFVNLFGELTGADVAASDDATGSSGDWVLEVTTGDIETAAIDGSAYAGVLAATPTATDDTAAGSASENGGTLEIDIDTLLANDVQDDDGNSLTLIDFETTSTEGGTITRPNGSLLYTAPTGDFSGSDTFRYRITDFDSDTGEVWGTVTVTVDNEADLPVATDFEVTDGVEGNAVIISVSDDLDPNISDADITYGGASWSVSGINSSNTASNGPITIKDASDSTIDAGSVSFANDQFTFTPEAGWSGDTSFEYVIQDGDVAGVSGQSYGTINLTLAPDNTAAPVIAADGGNADQPVLTDILEDVAEADNDGTLVSDILDGLTEDGSSRISDADDAGGYVTEYGVAITALEDDSKGDWQYSTDSGTTWTDIPAGVATGSALLLDGDAKVRFQPTDANYNTAIDTDPKSFTYKVWDRSNEADVPSGTTGVNTASGNAYSTATATAEIDITAVDDAPVLTLDADNTVTYTENDSIDNTALTLDGAATDTPTLAFDTTHISIADDHADEDNTMKITLEVSSGKLVFLSDVGGNSLGTSTDDTVVTLANFGTNSSVAVVQGTNDGTADKFILTGKESDLNELFAGPGGANQEYLAWYADQDGDGTVTLDVKLEHEDGTSDQEGTISLTTTGTNDAPTLAAGGVSMTTIVEDATTNAGQLVSDLIASKITDVDTISSMNDTGMAIIGGLLADGTGVTNGSWQYSTDSGANWTDFDPTGFAANDAMVLASTDMVRYNAEADEHGDATLSVVAWDGSDGATTAAAGSVDVSAAQGATDAYSATGGAITITQTITAVNDDPVINYDAAALTANHTANYTEDATVTFADGDDQEEISIADTEATDEGANVTVTLALPSGSGGTITITDDSAVTSSGDGSATVTLTGTVANVNTALATGVTYDPAADLDVDEVLTITVNDGTTTTTQTATMTVATVNDAPTLADVSGNDPDAYDEGLADDDVPGFTVASVLDGKVTEVDTDTDHTSEGIAITAKAGDGTWQYKLSADSDWTDMGAVAGTSALLLDPADSLRYLPADGDENTAQDTDATLTIRAWDQTNAGYDPGENGDTTDGSTAWSGVDRTITQTIDATEDGAVLQIGGTTVVAGDELTGTEAVAEGGVNGAIQLSDGDAIMSLSDVDGTSDTVTMTFSVDSGSMAFDATELASFAGTYDANSDDTVISLTGTVAQINALLDDTVAGGNDADPVFKFTPDDAEENPQDAILTVTVDNGSLGTDTYTIELNSNRVNDAPVVADAGGFGGNLDEETATLIDDFSITDVDHTDMEATLTATQGTITLGTASGLIIAEGGQGTESIKLYGSVTDINAALATLTYTPNDDYTGADTLTLAVDDGESANNTDSATINITVDNVNDAPTATAFYVQVNEKTGTAGETGITVTADLEEIGDATTNKVYSDSGFTTLLTAAAMDDIDTGDALVVEVLDDDGVTWITADGGTATTSAGGTVTIDTTNNTITYEGALGYSGDDSITYRMKDDSGDANTEYSAEQTINVDVVNVLNDTVTAEDDGTFTTDEDTALQNIDVLANDTGLDGINLAEDYGVIVTISSDPVDGNGDSAGTVQVNADNTITFIPAADFVGSASFDYQVQDKGSDGLASGQPSTATVDITVTATADAPEVTMPQSDYTVEEEATIDITGISIDDVDDPTSNIKVVIESSKGAPQLGTTTLVSVTEGNDATSSRLVAYGSVDNLNAALATLTYTGLVDETGDDQLTVTVDDLSNGYTLTGLTDEGSVDIEITAMNDAPDAPADLAKTVTQGVALTIDPLEAGGTDAEGDTLSVGSFTSPTAALGTVSLVDGNFVYTPNDGVDSGTDTFTFTVVDSGGKQAASATTVTLTIEAANQAPEVSGNLVYQVASTGDTVDLDLSNNTLVSDFEDDQLYIADFDYATENGGTVSMTNMLNGTFTYTPPSSAPESDTFNVIIGDIMGGQTEVTVTLMLDNGGNFEAVAEGDSATMVEDGDPIEITPLDNDWDFDNAGNDNTGITIATFDASTTGGGSVTLNGSGDTFTYTPAANFNGTDTFRYWVQDSTGELSAEPATITIEVTPVNDSPVATDDVIATVEDVAITGFGVMDNDNDSLDNDGEGNGAGLTISAVSDATMGTVTYDSDGLFTYTPDLNANGEDSFTYTVIDSDGETTTATVTVMITAVDDNPITQDDEVTTTEDTSVTIDVLDNDDDPERLESAYNPDNLGKADWFFIINTTDPDNGTVYTDADGNLEYVPDANWSGTDTFTYTVMDPYGKTSDATVTVNVEAAADMPTVGADSLTTNEDMDLVIDVDNNLFNNDVNNDDSTVDLTLASFTQPTAGTGTIVDNGDGTLTYSPAADWYGTTTFDYTAQAPGGLSANGTVTITVDPINDGPEISVPGSNPAGDEDTSFAITDISVSDADASAGDNTVEVTLTTAEGGAMTLVSVSNIEITGGANGTDTITFTGEIAEVNSALSSMQYIGAEHFNGTETIVVSVNDLGNYGDTEKTTSANVYVTVNSVADAPILSDISYDSGVEDSVGITLTGEMFDAGFQNVESSDTLASIKVTALPTSTEGSLELDGVAVTVDQVIGITNLNNNELKFVPVADWNGDSSFTWNGTHETGGSPTYSDSDANFTVTVSAVNDAPVLTVGSAVTTLEDTSVAISTVSISDLDNELANDVTVTMSVNDGTISVTEMSGVTVTGNSSDSMTVTGSVTSVNTVLSSLAYVGDAYFNGSDTLSVEVNDNENGGSGELTDSDTVDITITAVSNAPVAGADSFSLNEGSSVTFTVADLLGNDSNVEDTSVALEVISNTSTSSGTLTVSGDLSDSTTTFTYTPDSDFNGTDSFMYTVTNNAGGNVLGDVSLVVSAVNDAPTIDTSSVPTLSVNTGEELSISGIQIDDSDVDETADGEVQMTLTAGVTDAQLSLSSTPSNLTVTGADSNSMVLTGSLADVQTALYNLKYTAGTAAGSDTISMTLDDQGNTGDTSQSVSSSLAVTISEANVDPVASTDVVVIPASPSGSYEISGMLSNDTDGNNDSLFIAGFSRPANSSDAILRYSNGTFSYTPGADFTGLDWFTYRISDGMGGFSESIIYITDDADNANIPSGSDVIHTYTSELEQPSEEADVITAKAEAEAEAEAQIAEAELMALFQPKEEAAAAEKSNADQANEEHVLPLSEGENSLNDQLHQAGQDDFEAEQANLMALLGSVTDNSAA
uniref:M1 protein n=1 Tax=Magnetococcus massalia (strain MO-1) TaxID=451514 RepID=E2EZU4_MAGMO|nr:M1 protein [Candidatus Magnetococcus massalia]CRH04457.1 Sheath associated protein M1. putative outer membrane adhesin like protein [Candidatus Magnetococcus massalia]